MRVSTMSLKTISEIKTLNDYRILDLGAGDGASLATYEKIIGGKGLGIELDEKKVKKAQGLDRNVYLGNALDLHRIGGKVDYVTCDNFLEHLPNKQSVFEMLDQAFRVSEKFVFIRHPSFEDIEYLKGHGLKSYWSHWRGHTSMLTIGDFSEMFISLGVSRFMVVPVYRINNSNDSKLIPISAPVDQHDYDKDKHGEKPELIRFDKDVYYSFDIVAMNPGYTGKMPELVYNNRLEETKHPRFVFEQDSKSLRKEIELLKNRKVIRLADRVKLEFKNLIKGKS